MDRATMEPHFIFQVAVDRMQAEDSALLSTL
jgi:hypothetical protein